METMFDTTDGDATQWGSPQARGTLEGPHASRNIDASSTADDFWAR